MRANTVFSRRRFAKLRGAAEHDHYATNWSEGPVKMMRKEVIDDG